MRKLAFLTSAGLVVLAMSVLLFATSGSVRAAAAIPGVGGTQALEIAPPVLVLTADPGQTIKTQISLRDVANNDLLVTAQVNDFVAAGEDGTPKIITHPSGVNPYSIKSWIATFPKLLMKPRQIVNVPVTIKVPADASPGGHYGVLRFSGTAPTLGGQGVSLSASLGSLMLVTVNGDIKEKLSVAEFSANTEGARSTFFNSAPIHFVTRLKNEGNVHEQPIGQIRITDMFGKNVANLNVNLPPRNVLPSSIRRFESPLDSTVIGNKRLFGRYHAALKVTYGKTNQLTTADMYFWVVPYKLIAGVVVLIVGGFFGLKYLITRYNRAIVKRAQNPKRKK